MSSPPPPHPPPTMLSHSLITGSGCTDINVSAPSLFLSQSFILYFSEPLLSSLNLSLSAFNYISEHFFLPSSVLTSAFLSIHQSFALSLYLHLIIAGNSTTPYHNTKINTFALRLQVYWFLTVSMNGIKQNFIQVVRTTVHLTIADIQFA